MKLEIQTYPSSRQRPLLMAAFLMLLICIPGIGFAQINEDVDAGSESDLIDRVPVIVDGYELFKVRGVSNYSAEVRAETIANRIRKLAANDKFPVDSIKKVTYDHRILISGLGQPILNVYEEDGTIEALSKEVMADLAIIKIRESITRYRTERNPRYLQASLLKAAIATVVLILTVFFFVLLFHRLNEWFKRRIQTKINKLENVSFNIIKSEQLFAMLHWFYKILRIAILLFIFLFYLDYVLSLFPNTRQVSNFIFRLLIDPLEKIGTGILDELPNLIFLFFIFLITQYLIRLVRLFFQGIHYNDIRIDNFDSEWAMPTFKIVKLLLVVFALVIAFPYIPGSDSNAFQGISVFLGILFSLGSSSFIANIIAGYSMTYRRAFKKGDRIQIDEFMGFVEDQSLMVTRVRSIKNEEIIIPNSVLLNSNIRNFSQAAKDRGIIIHTTVGIGYETPWRLVEAMLIEAALRTEGVLADPPPYILQKALADFAVTYEINAYCDDPIKMYFILTDLHRHILDVFNENNIQIMTPAYEGDPELPKVVGEPNWFTPLAKTNSPKTKS